MECATGLGPLFADMAHNFVSRDMTQNSLQVAVTGGAGFIGQHFCGRLNSQGALASIIDIRAPARPIPGVRSVVGDVRDTDALRAALRGANAVLHLAAAHHDYGITRETFFGVNEGGARALCAVMDEQGIRKLCFFSSVAVYGSHDEPPDEDTACRPESHYGESKLAVETVFREWAAKGEGRTVLVIRPTVTFGPGHFANMYTLVRQIRSRLYVSVGRGTNRKSLVYIDNIVDATMTLWARGNAPAFDVFNAVDKPDLTSRAIGDAVFGALDRSLPRFSIPLWAALIAAFPFDVIISVTGLNLPISSDRVRKFAIANSVFRADKLKNAGITPGITLETGIERMVAWYLEEGSALPLDRSVPPPDPILLSATPNA